MPALVEEIRIDGGASEEAIEAVDEAVQVQWIMPRYYAGYMGSRGPRSRGDR